MDHEGRKTYYGCVRAYSQRGVRLGVVGKRHERATSLNSGGKSTGQYVSEFLSRGRCDITASQPQLVADAGRGPEKKNESCVHDIGWP
jgi:hypothetical protein